MKPKFNIKKISRFARIISALFFLLVIPCGLHNIYADEPVPSSGLISDPKKYDGKIIYYEGEVIGDIMKRGEHAWINVNDGSNAMGIWIKTPLADGIKYAGGYKLKGDIVKITGVFNRICTVHGGDMDIHATDMQIVTEGRETPKNAGFEKMIKAIILAVILLFIVAAGVMKKR